jgi:hypothetical protein
MVKLIVFEDADCDPATNVIAFGSGVGIGVGFCVGSGVGVSVGCAVGAAVGVAVGTVVGAGVGVGEGFVTGVGVGEGVAAGVGVGVPPVILYAYAVKPGKLSVKLLPQFVHTVLSLPVGFPA